MAERERGLGQACTIRGSGGKSFFLNYSFWGPGWDPRGYWAHRRACRGILGKPAGALRGSGVLPELSQVSICSAWLSREGKISGSLPFHIQISRQNTCVRIRSVDCDSWIWFRVPTDCWSFSFQGQLLLFCGSPFEFWELGLATVGSPKDRQTEMWSSQENCLSLPSGYFWESLCILGG